MSDELPGDPPLIEEGPPVAGSRGALAAFDRVPLPEWALVRQRMDPAEIDDVRQAVRTALEPQIAAVAPGARACVAVGSRGIDRIDEVTGAVVERLREAGADVFIVPAMGSHGGASAAGQLQVLAGYGITPATMGCEIRSSMETVELGDAAPGVPVFIDRHALEESDIVIPVNRVKRHTGFDGDVESGLLKMIAIGLGKRGGADTLHRQGYARFPELIPAVALHVLARMPIRFGVALVENGYGRLRDVEAVPAAAMLERERELLVMARAAMAQLPVAALDVLVVDEIGKDVSGTGMDTNVVGRGSAAATRAGPAVQRIVVRDLTRRTEGNAVGVGLADVVLRRAVAKIDMRATYVNSIAAKAPERARIPITVDSDREALSVAIASALNVTPRTTRIVRIRDTSHLELLYMSAPALREALATGRCEIVEPLHPIRFDTAGMFADDGFRGIGTRP